MVTPWDAYYKKLDNLRSRPGRARFWHMIINMTQPIVVVEVGCGDGLNLEHIIAPTLIGIDSYAPSLQLAHDRLNNGTILMERDARNLRPWPDRFSDLAFTCTTLQHIADDEQCRTALRELIRISREWVLVMEYEAEERTPIAWRGSSEGIVKRPWGKMLEREGLTIHGTGFLPHDDDAFDDVTWYLCKR